MSAIAPEILSALESQEYRPAVLLHMNIVSTIIRYTTWTQPVIHEGVLYESRGLEFQNVNYSSNEIVDNVTVSIDDVNRDLYAVFQNYSPSKNPVKIILVVLDQQSKVIGDVGFSVFSGYLDGWNYAPGRFELSCVSIFAQWGNVTVERFSNSCRHRKFRGPYCKYNGESAEDCDRSYKACKDTFENSDNFGGFRWIAKLINTEIKE